MQKPYARKLLLMAAFVVGVFAVAGPNHRSAPPTTSLPLPHHDPLAPQTPVAQSAVPPVLPEVSTVPSPSPAKPTVAVEPEHPVYPYTALLNPTGTLYSMESFWNRLSATTGWNAVSTINGAPVIAVIDTGFALSHQELTSRWTTARWDFIHGDGSPDAGQSNPAGVSVFHGTMTAGLTTLINPNTRIMPIQALDDDGSGNTNTVAAAVQYAVNNGANIVSLSLGSTFDDTFLRQQIDSAIAKGVLVVAAAGNSGCNCLSYPAAYPEVLSVGANDSADNRAGFSSYGTNLDVMAPGVAGDVCSTFYSQANPTSAYSCAYSGTSFATPIVAGLAGLLLNQDPGAGPGDLMRFITQSADKTASMAGAERSLQQGYGRIDIAKAVQLASLAAADGQAINKHNIRLSSTDPATSPAMDTTCLGVAGSTCEIKLVGPGNQTITLGSQVLDASGTAEFIWNASTLGLTVGNWQISATLTAFGQSILRPLDLLIISP